MSKGWIGVDLDGTLAEYTEWDGITAIGKIIPLMKKRVLTWLNQGVRVKIFTARVDRSKAENEIVTNAIHSWLIKNGLPKLEVTNEKDYGMIELWDDRCVPIEQNTGKIKRIDEKAVYLKNLMSGIKREE